MCAGAAVWDTQQFYAGLQDDDPVGLARAFGHYRGPFLDGFDAETSREFMLWLEPTREHYAALMRDVATRLYEHYRQTEQTSAALAVLQFWVGLEP